MTKQYVTIGEILIAALGNSIDDFIHNPETSIQIRCFCIEIQIYEKSSRGCLAFRERRVIIVVDAELNCTVRLRFNPHVVLIAERCI